MNVFLPDFKISLRPNNQVTVTRQRLIRKNEPFFCLSENENRSHSDLTSVVDRYRERNGLQDSYFLPHVGKVKVATPYTAKLPGGVCPALLLDITSKFQRDNKASRRDENETKKGYGSTPTIKDFSAKAGQKIRECGAAIDILTLGEPSKCRVVTLTIPSSEISAYKAISDYSGYATNRLLQVIRRTKDEGFYWFYCVEHQKRGALHWHICLFHEDEDKSRVVADAVVSKWRDILRDIGSRCGVDLLYSKGFGRVVASSEMQCLNQEMRKGCGAYFSKYAAKTSHTRESRKTEDINTRNARLYPPSSFWGRSHNLARVCRENSFLYKFNGIYNEESESLRGEAFELLSQFDVVLTHSFSFKKEIQHFGGSLTVCEGESEVIYLKPEDYAKLLSLCRDKWGKSPSSRIPERARLGGYLSEYETEIGFF